VKKKTPVKPIKITGIGKYAREHLSINDQILVQILWKKMRYQKPRPKERGMSLRPISLRAGFLIKKKQTFMESDTQL